jgi:1-acyl-sn-glycerol-3-phosphate acyltransferase
MIAILRGARSLVCVLLVILLFALDSPPLRLVVVPACWLFPRHRQRLTSLFMKWMSHNIQLLLRLGGAHFTRRGQLPTGTPVLIVANHQGLLDITQITLLAQPSVPAFVSRRRYAYFVPLVAQCIRLLRSPIVDPKRDPAGSVEAIRRGARELSNGIVIFPEGHRSADGSVRPFRSAGIEAILSERRMPVYLVLNDGLWRTRRLVDLLFRVHEIDALSEVMGPLEPPEDAGQLPAFVRELRQRLIDRMAEVRAGAPSIG